MNETCNYKCLGPGDKSEDVSVSFLTRNMTILYRDYNLEAD